MHRFAAEWATAASVFADCRERWRSLAVVGVVFRVASALLIAPLYALLLPAVLLLDRALPAMTFSWRRGLAFCVALLAVSETWARLMLATGAFGIA